jgi:hypothetical protein
MPVGAPDFKASFVQAYGWFTKAGKWVGHQSKLKK